MSTPPGNPATYSHAARRRTAIPRYSSAFGIVYRLPMPRPQIAAAARRRAGDHARFDDSALVMTMNSSVARSTRSRASPRGIDDHDEAVGEQHEHEHRTPIFPVFDEWTVMTDGAVAVLRGREYRIDFYDGDGARTAGPRLPYPWKQARRRREDAARRLDQHAAAQAVRRHDRRHAEAGADTNQKIGPGGEKIIIVDGMPIRTYGGERMPPPTPPASVQPTEIPDYLPAVERNAGGLSRRRGQSPVDSPQAARGGPRNAAAERSTTSSTGREH